ncbi:LANO_0G04588g1_1 [Lachancea nothofagi CBS 11611]|uniref:LANO_0G04588g1_1 n=1 Tax=Lachancea nothofagi CBS 11611 TaxID=1266666 RepID=A0A1G4KG87_9SACH|nr:LANO_0G04588g1_1 [Lachancea nothofagi CBS 11611]
MQVSTPISTTGFKNLHSPPSVGSSSPSSARTFKKFSGQVMTRVNTTFRNLSASSVPSPNRLQVEERPCLIQTSSSRFAASENIDFGPTSLPVTKPVMNIGKRRSKPPAPLCLNPITPRPTPRKSHSSSKATPRLESPMDLGRSNYSSSDCASWVTASSAEPRRRLDSAFKGDFSSPMSHFTINQPFRDPWADLYPESESPTYAAELRKNVSKVSGPKNFASNNCSICNESLTCALAGEKPIELSCDHQCHYNCFLVSFEAFLPRNSFPKCSICKSISKPKSDDVLSELTAKVLCKSPESRMIRDTADLSYSDQIRPQTIGRPSEYISGHAGRVQDLQTPCDQVIRSAQIMSGGFRHSYSSESTPNRKPSISSRGSSFRTRSFMSRSDGQDDEFDFSKPRIHLIPQLSKFNIKTDAQVATAQYVMSAHLPKNALVAETVKKQKNEENRIRNDIQGFVESTLKCTTSTGPLETLDMLSYSEDEDIWTSVTAFLFRECLIMTVDGLIVENIAKHQISELHQLDPYTIIINLKSKSLPEIFLCCENDPAIIRKWFYYLKQVYLSAEGQSVPIEQLTSNSWEILPKNITQKIRPKDENSDNLDEFEPRLSVFAPHGRSPLKIVLCLSIINCHPRLHSNSDYLDIIKSKLRQFLSSLSTQDFIGLAIVGKDGSGKVGPFGTFIGMVNKSWDGFEDLVDGLQVYDNDEIFMNDFWEMNIMLETCRKLICTVEQEESYLQQLVLLGNDYPVNMPASIEDDFQVQRVKRNINAIANVFNFSICQYFTCNSKLWLSDLIDGLCYSIKCKGKRSISDACLGELVHDLQQSSVKSFALSICSVDSSVVQFSAIESNGQLFKLPHPESELNLEIGALRPGEVKNVVFEVNINVANLRHMLGNNFLAQDSSSSLLHYSAQWHDGSGYLVSQGYSFGCEFRFTSSGTTVSPMYSLRTPIQTNSQESQDSDHECLNISLAPPMSASRDMFFATRQMELIAVDTLIGALCGFPRDTSTTLNHLVSMIFCISRNCVCNDPGFYRHVFVEPIGRYAEKLCFKLQHIAELSSSEDRGIQALSRWMMRELKSGLISQGWSGADSSV